MHKLSPDLFLFAKMFCKVILPERTYCALTESRPFVVPENDLQCYINGEDAYAVQEPSPDRLLFTEMFCNAI